ncbi:thioredoxin domain-containing protein [Sphingomonas sp. PR090111-T3T-6A]|uniref:thioredoxin domain-containing protein n=1 Tax=Sphingomonas sp. PR090111-T3T-6A TaxID=685778 RepID=UPI00037B2D49|nr:thioredoxin domain-containing protein [Sphingomonas sp. PR090111-T3T-6A]
MTIKNRLLLTGFAMAALTLAGCQKKADDSAATATAPATPAASSGPVGAAPAGGWASQISQTADGGYLMGNPNAPVKLIEYGSRTCPHCAKFTEEGFPELKSKYIDAGKVSYEFRDFAIHPMDPAAILLGQCNGATTFFPILEQMMADQPNVFPKLDKLPANFQQEIANKTPNEQAAAWGEQLGYVQFVGQRGVPEAKAKACLADPKALDALSKRMQDGVTRYNVSFTPFFVVNGKPAGENTTVWSALEPILKGAGA